MDDKERRADQSMGDVQFTIHNTLLSFSLVLAEHPDLLIDGFLRIAEDCMVQVRQINRERSEKD